MAHSAGMGRGGGRRPRRQRAERIVARQFSAQITAPVKTSAPPIVRRR